MDFINWRYNKYIKPYMPIDKNIYSLINRKYNNSRIIKNDKLVFYLSADAKNIGDYVSAQGVKFLLGLNGLESFVSSRGLSETKNNLDSLKYLKKNVHIVVGGGGLLQECFNPFWDVLLNSELKFSLFGIGANELQPVRNLLDPDLLRGISEGAGLIHVRDDWTKSLLIKDYDRDITVGFCPALNYLSHKYLNLDNFKEDSLLYVDHPTDVNIAGGDSTNIKSILEGIANELNLNFRYTNHIGDSLDLIIKLYKKSKIIISSRLHGCIISYSLNKNFIPIICDKKTLEFVKTHNAEVSILDVNFNKRSAIEAITMQKYENNLNYMEKSIINYSFGMKLKNYILNEEF